MMNLLQISTRGMKNISQNITIDFANATVDRGVKKVNNVKGIFGYNGSGKTALMTSVYLYLRLSTNARYLLQNETIDKLEKMINRDTNSFYFSIVFDASEDLILKHEVFLTKNNKDTGYMIAREVVSHLVGRTINERYVEDVVVERGVIQNKPFMDSPFLENLRLKIQEDTSIVALFLDRLAELANEKKHRSLALSPVENELLAIGSLALHTDVYLQDGDTHSNYFMSKKALDHMISKLETIKAKDISLIGQYFNSAVILKETLEEYQKDTRKLEKFIQIFKPKLKGIEIEKTEDGDYYHVRRVFVYDTCKVDFEFESSGIKQLVHLFSYLLKCANGNIVFVDEIDTNLNSVYFSKLISFFVKYGKGQLIFTTHNIESMNALRRQPKSILALGEDNKMDVWIGKGNRSPIKDYVEGFFPNSPMNLEDFDFIHVFMGED